MAATTLVLTNDPPVDIGTPVPPDPGVPHRLPNYIATHHEMLPVFGVLYTHRAVKSGPWADPATWAVNQVPGTQSNVYIPYGLTVTLGAGLHAFAFCNVLGGLKTDPDATFQVDCRCLPFTFPGSSFEDGTTARPVSPSVSHTWTFRDVPLLPAGPLNVEPTGLVFDYHGQDLRWDAVSGKPVPA